MSERGEELARARGNGSKGKGLSGVFVRDYQKDGHESESLRHPQIGEEGEKKKKKKEKGVACNGKLLWQRGSRVSQHGAFFFRRRRAISAGPRWSPWSWEFCCFCLVFCFLSVVPLPAIASWVPTSNFQVALLLVHWSRGKGPGEKRS